MRLKSLSLLLLLSFLLLSFSPAFSEPEEADTRVTFKETDYQSYFDKEEQVELDDYDNEELDYSGDDPFEAKNRAVFSFNDFLYKYIVEPTHKVYKCILPEPIRDAVENFHQTTLAPLRMVNALLQGDPMHAIMEFEHTMINVLTSAGFANVAKEAEGYFPYHPENLVTDRTLYKWGIPDGSYFVVPVRGPSTVRSFAAFLLDFGIDPTSYLLEFWHSVGMEALYLYNNVDTKYEMYDTIVGGSLLPYESIRNAYMSERAHRFKVMRQKKELDEKKWSEGKKRDSAKAQNKNSKTEMKK